MEYDGCWLFGRQRRLPLITAMAPDLKVPEHSAGRAAESVLEHWADGSGVAAVAHANAAQTRIDYQADDDYEVLGETAVPSYASTLVSQTLVKEWTLHTNSQANGHEPVRGLYSDKKFFPRPHEDIGEPLERVVSLVPLSRRRGLLSQITITAEREDPYTYSALMKATILFVVSFAAVLSTFAGAVLLPALDHVAEELGTSKQIVNISYGAYTLSIGIFPLWWSSISEASGRRTVYLVSFALFTAFAAGCALSPNMGCLMAFRILCGAACASVQAVGAGTLSDIYEPSQRGRAMGYFFLGPFMGPMLAPIIGGAVTMQWGWRATMWFNVILGGIITVLVLLFVPETLPRNSKHRPAVMDDDPTQNVDVLAPVSSRSSHGRIEVVQTSSSPPSRRDSTDDAMKSPRVTAVSVATSSPKYTTVLYNILIKPLATFRLLRYPPVPLAISMSTYIYAVMFVMYVSLQTLYAGNPYKFSAMLQGLTYLPGSVGYILASVGNGYWSDWIIARCLKRDGSVIPEKRLGPQVYMGIIMAPISLLIFGWCAQYRVTWVAPLVGSFFFGVSVVLIFGNVATYLIDALPGRGSSGVALNNFFRMTLSAIGTFVAASWEEGIGFGWMYTMLAIGTLVCPAALAVIKLRGHVWRESFDMNKLS